MTTNITNVCLIPLLPRRWGDINLFIWRASKVRIMAHNAGLPPAAVRLIIRECSEQANANHEMFLKLARQMIDIAIDRQDMLAEGYSVSEIETYLNRNYRAQRPE